MRGRSARTAVAALALCAVLLAALVPTAGASGPPSIAPVVGPSSALPLAGLSSALAAPFAARAGYEDWFGSAASHATAADGSELVVVTLAPSEPGLFDPPLPGAPRESVGQIADEFGVPAPQYSEIAQYFESEGLSVVHAWPDRLALSLEGPTAAVNRAFGTTEMSGSYAGRPVTFPSAPPTLPASIQSEVTSVLGLSSGFDEFSLPVTPAVAVSPGAGASGTPISPAILRQWYDISPLYNLTSSPTYASGEGVAVLLWGDGYDPSDISGFFSQYYPSGFPQPSIVPYPMDGAPAPSPGAVNDPDRSAPQELTLDIEWAGSFAPGATIDAVYAPDGPAPGYSPTSSSMADALHQVVSLGGVSTLSMSFGTPESGDASLEGAWATYLAEAEHEGITIVAATGDLGGDASSGCAGGPAPDYPATDPNILAVGGTVVALQQNLLGQISSISESGWIGSGGGFSTQFAAPSWQTGVTGNAHRGIPDVSASAYNNFLYYTGQAEVADGTSFATPLWAGLIAEMDALHGGAFGLLSPRLYAVGENESSGRIGGGLYDVTTGGNCVANAGPGWDAATGWGTPRGIDLYEALTASFVNLSLSIDPSAVAPAGSVTISAHLANATTHAPIANVPVVVSLASDENFGPCTGTFGSSSPPTDANGNVQVSLSVPVCYLGSKAVVTVTVISNGYYGQNSTTIPVNLVALVPALEGITTYPYSVVGFVGIMAIASVIGGLLGMRGPTRRPAAGPPAGAASPPTVPPSPTPPSAAEANPPAGGSGPPTPGSAGSPAPEDLGPPG